LAERRDAGGQLEAVAEALGLDTVPGVARLDQIPAALRQRSRQQPSLLVLDNFEQLLAHEAVEGEGVSDGAGALAHLLAAVPALLCLVTSRQRLGIPGEQELVLKPLPVPGWDAGRRTTDHRFEPMGRIPTNGGPGHLGSPGR